MQLTRAQRREYERLLKKTDPQKYKEWKDGAYERGKHLHQAHVENAREAQSAFYERKQKDIIKSLRDSGLSDAEIDAYMEKWVDGIKPI